MRRAVRSAMLAGAIVVGLSGTSLADDAAAAQRDAQSRFNEGIARVQSGNFEGARMSFTQAYAVLHKPDILWNLALTEEKCGMALSALQHFKDYARQVTSANDRLAASKHIAELGTKTGHIEVLAPSGATIVVDGITVGEAPLDEPVDVEPGRHHVVERIGGVAKSAESDVTPGQVVHVSFVTIDPDLPPGPPGPSVVSVPVPLPLQPEVPPANVAGGESPPASSRPAGSFWTPKVIVTGSLGVAAIAAGVTGFALARTSDSLANSAQQIRSNGTCPTGCTQLNDKVSAQHNDYVASLVLGTAGGVLLAGAVVTWFVWPKAVSTVAGGPGLRVVPSVGVDGAGAVVSGTF